MTWSGLDKILLECIQVFYKINCSTCSRRSKFNKIPFGNVAERKVRNEACVRSFQVGNFARNVERLCNGSVGDHDTFRGSCCSRSINDCRKVIVLRQNRFNFWPSICQDFIPSNTCLARAVGCENELNGIGNSFLDFIPIVKFPNDQHLAIRMD